MAKGPDLTAGIVARRVACTCDELNNVLTGIMLRTGLLRQLSPDPMLQEIERLSLRARTAVQDLRSVADEVMDTDAGEGVTDTAIARRPVMG